MNLLRIKSGIVHGKFISESKNRFLCKVLINNSIEECYIPSSSRLDNYLKLKNKDILLTTNKGKNTRTRYSVFAVKYYGKYILLNLKIVNKLVEKYIRLLNMTKQNIKIYKEQKIENYKADLIIKKEKEIIVEAKGLIGIRREVVFPSVFSQRAISQLKKIRDLLKQGYEIEYYLVSLSPIIRKVIINNEIEEFKTLMYECIENGMNLKGFSVSYNKERVYIEKQPKILL
ncbi:MULTISPECIES: DNA/RNA nuclease SfsA [unclassified Candidatus Frackibacter]|uniref:DNA/RNA nuclease SfsA n=1 Tax=unclassified Candidatus Frackibacter TaxID=2648818 RepID=UPI000885C211|nr:MULTISPECIES: DNA/RNA nuclease SfsA [unclassified Candidatus Frackibacter]SDC30785.1 DNA-binding protein, stimulates sugar fermentation [Candidatus Frackibacter sp. WG11]SEM73956.1 DNA-binding protein, stimulates sugar fermentation [Candidatus Frackibacter sp. WG12]SFL58648.1 DNA-binding protein, stimulates sugar fermentation [Candidatus Frackibacter sp. WG13]